VKKIVLKNVLNISLLLLINIFPGVLSAQQDEGNIWLSENEMFQVSYESQLNPIIINQIHSWKLLVMNAQGDAVSDAIITVKGGMPEHNHGLATAPSIEARADGDYLLQGLRFHMMGYWELELNITQGSISDTVIITLDL
jgi:hypothetical protein